ncbi:hypothetical protein T492DRAFT_878497 [Pavlovales sp. CCMP2436]|nr:hypothetical protein T492DRAFT_878497 [Pavlovales sp. CCMP2436]
MTAATALIAASLVTVSMAALLQLVPVGKHAVMQVVAVVGASIHPRRLSQQARWKAEVGA